MRCPPPAAAAGRHAGSDATVFSFYANKTMTTGEGGMLVTRDETLARRARMMRLHGMNRDAFDRFTAKVPSWYYEIVAPGFKYNLTDIAAALGLHQLKRAQGFQRRARHRRSMYDAGLRRPAADHPPQPAAGDLHAWHLYVLRLADEAGWARPLHRGAVRARHRLQRALHPAAPAPLLARPLRAAAADSSRTARRPTSAMLSCRSIRA
jgi:dTDP-4-amino-4,6-dideoxygalactose transaminase